MKTDANRKPKHGQRIITYRWTSYAGYCHGEQYIHPEIIVSYGSGRDPLAEYSRSGEEYYLERAKRIRDAVGDTLYADNDHGLSGSFAVRWQSNRESGGDRGYHYVPFYGAKISDCGFEGEIIALAAKLAKLAKQCGAHWSTEVLEVIEALKAMKAYAITWNKQADAFTFCDHLEDSMFGLPADLRTPADASVAA